MTRKLKDAVVVVTGASSGIGRATALAFARKGASLVLAARRERALEEVASACESVGGRAIAVATDVTDEDAVDALARHAAETFGRIDVWVNNAAVTLFGRFEETPPHAWRRVIETNLFGYVHGTRAALPYLREQGQGVIVNVSSMVAETGQPYTSAYVTSKHAIRGLSECLRMETRDTAIEVCTVLPASIDTPLFQNAANYTGTAAKPMSPVYDAELVATTIVDLARRPKREVIVGNAGRMIAAMRTMAPPVAERMMARQVQKDHFIHDKPAPRTEGNLFEPSPGWTTVSGGWLTGTRKPRAASAVATALVAGVTFAAWALAYRDHDEDHEHA